MKIEMKRREILDLWRTMKSFSEEKVSKKFIFAIALNETALEDEVTAITKTRTPATEYAEYEQKRAEIISEHADVRDGKLITEGEYIKIKNEDKDTLREKISNLDIDYSDVIGKRNQDLVDFRELLESTTTINLQTVKYDDLPEVISKNDFLAMKHMIDMEED